MATKKPMTKTICANQSLSPSGLGISMAIVWGSAVFLCTLFSYYSGAGYGMNGAGVLASIYPGYTVTPLGAIGGLLYGLIDGFIFGALIAWIYNKVK